jgi:hypothetical protein
MGKYLRCNIIPASLNDRPRIRFHESASPSQPSLRLCSSKKNNVRADSPVTNKGTQVTAFSLLSGRRNSLIRGTAAPHSWTSMQGFGQTRKLQPQAKLASPIGSYGKEEYKDGLISGISIFFPNFIQQLEVTIKLSRVSLIHLFQS